jgi:Fe-S cluster biogenesis protein NfuA
MSEALDLKARVAAILTDEVAPALQLDGGAIELLEVSGGVARVRLRGGFSCCPSTIMAIVLGLDQELCRRVPEISYVEAVA